MFRNMKKDGRHRNGSAFLSGKSPRTGWGKIGNGYFQKDKAISPAQRWKVTNSTTYGTTVDQKVHSGDLCRKWKKFKNRECLKRESSMKLFYGGFGNTPKRTPRPIPEMNSKRFWAYAQDAIFRIGAKIMRKKHRTQVLMRFAVFSVIQVLTLWKKHGGLNFYTEQQLTVLFNHGDIIESEKVIFFIKWSRAHPSGILQPIRIRNILFHYPFQNSNILLLLMAV